jgi:hypothetical protein
METLLEGVTLGCAQAHPVAPPLTHVLPQSRGIKSRLFKHPAQDLYPVNLPNPH